MSDSERIDGIGLARDPSRATSAGHELGRDSNDLLTARDQEALEVAGYMTTVLQREDAVVVELAGPYEHALVPLVAGFHGHLRKRLPALLGGHRSVGLFVWINTHYDHLLGPPFRRANRRDGKDPPADTPQSGHVFRPSSYQVTLANLSQVAGDISHEGHPSTRETPMLRVTPSPGSRLDRLLSADLIPANPTVTLTAA